VISLSLSPTDRSPGVFIYLRSDDRTREVASSEEAMFVG